MLQLMIIAGPDNGKRFVLHPGKGNMLGRSTDAAYVLNDPRVSRFQCEIRVEGSKVTIADNNSSGGTFVNRTRITEVVLNSGDVIQVGESLLKFDDGTTANTQNQMARPKQADQDAKAVEELSHLVGRSLGPFEINKAMGQGGNGMVFEATDTRDDSIIALKVMHPSFSKEEEEMQRFVRGMKTVMPLRHPNIITTFSAGKTGPYCWIAMEHVEGENLTTVIKRIGVAGMLDWKYAFTAALHIGRALEYAHGQGIIHRNVMPSNILVRNEDKQMMLGDLMLAKALEGTLAQQVTRPGEVVGDVNYMSPERTQSTGAVIDGRSDLFSLGATAYALLTGKPPFAGSTIVETITRIRQSEPLLPSTFQMGIPSQFEGAVMKLLAKRPEERYQTASELVRDLERIGKFSGAII